MAHEKNTKQHVTSKWEWVAAAVSALIVLGILGVLIGEATAESTPPDITLRADSIVAVSDGFVVSITAHNRGTGTASNVTVNAELLDGSSVVETASATFDYIPGESRRGGGMFFRRDPRSLTLRMKAAGWQDP